MKKVIYCEMRYWNKLFGILSESKSPFDDDFEKLECASKMCKAIFRASQLKFDDKKEFDKARKDQVLLRRMVDRSENVNGYVDINCDYYQELPNIDVNCLNSLFLSETHLEDALLKGVFALDVERTANEPNLYKDFGESISKKQQLSWREILKNAVHNCNAMLMFDNYLLNWKEQNLYKIFDSLLPQSLDNSLDFDLSIFTMDNINLENEYQIIVNKLNSLRPNLKVNFTLFQCSKGDFHDRAIITNYLWIGCGGGFDLLKKDKRGFHEESGKTTTIPMVYPDLQDSTNWAPRAYENFINDAQKIQRNNRHIGSGINRLL